jgi:hypothetical protein
VFKSHKSQDKGVGRGVRSWPCSVRAALRERILVGGAFYLCTGGDFWTFRLKRKPYLRQSLKIKSSLIVAMNTPQSLDVRLENADLLDEQLLEAKTRAFLVRGGAERSPPKIFVKSKKHKCSIASNSELSEAANQFFSTDSNSQKNQRAD